ncbi:MAG TPA: LLM class flavin-dependent oxidoreductase [Solirubrobacteraceae bacterium]|jgi:alkanesulfonate monooxygenase SsuD/methylene tetrahydromethanopterin reductase-like flavin-dependent oxidoreductase (luciferase family)
MVAFGVSLVPAAADLDRVFALTRIADEAGLELVGVQDHPYQRRFVDTFALLGHLLARTSRISVFPDVANLPLRPPAVLAKHAATLDVLSGGRFELGLGAGGFWEAIHAMGGPSRTPGEWWTP